MTRYLPVLFAAAVFADAPRLPPSTFRATSLNGRYSAEVNHVAKRITVVDTRTKTKLYEIAGWYRVVAVSNDGHSLVIGYDGSNLLSAGFSSEQPMLTFYQMGQKGRVVKLRELVPDLGLLRKTASHWVWGQYIGFDEKNRYQVKTVDGRLLRFDAATGGLVP